MANDWYYLRNGVQAGPVVTARLKELAACGELVPSDLVWKEGMDEWVPAQNLTGLTFIPAGAGLGVKPDDLSWLDRQLIQTSWVALIAIAVLFFGVMLIFSVIALLMSKHPAARKKAKILFAICFGYVAVGVIAAILIALFSR